MYFLFRPYITRNEIAPLGYSMVKGNRILIRREFYILYRLQVRRRYIRSSLREKKMEKYLLQYIGVYVTVISIDASEMSLSNHLTPLQRRVCSIIRPSWLKRERLFETTVILYSRMTNFFTFHTPWPTPKY